MILVEIGEILGDQGAEFVRPSIAKIGAMCDSVSVSKRKVLSIFDFRFSIFDWVKSPIEN